MRARGTVVLLVLASVLSGSAALGQEVEAPVIVPEAQFRPRYEWDTGRDGVAGQGQVSYTTHRARLGATMMWDDFSVRLVFQDVRAWGEELDTRRDFSADGMDLAIGVFQWSLAEPLTLTVGREEVSLLDERLVARAGWRQPGRHFDGLRLTWDDDRWEVEGAAYIARDGSEFNFANTDQVRPGPGNQTLSWLRGGYATDTATAQALVVLDSRTEVEGSEIMRWTPGVFLKGQRGILKGRLEGYAQLGSVEGGDGDIRAWMVGAEGTVSPDMGGKPSFTLGYDVLSGDSDPDDDTLEAFDAIRGANHRYYGHSDIAYFLQGGRSDNRGLHNPYLRVQGEAADKLTVRLDQHLFAPQQAQGGPAMIAAETDLEVRYQVHPALALSAGGSTWTPVGGNDGPTEGWMWLMLDVGGRGPKLAAPVVAGVP